MWDSLKISKVLKRTFQKEKEYGIFDHIEQKANEVEICLQKNNLLPG